MVLPGFGEFSVFEKSKPFFILFFGWALQKGSQGPGKGPNKLEDVDIYIPTYQPTYIYDGAL